MRQFQQTCHPNAYDMEGSKESQNVPLAGTLGSSKDAGDCLLDLKPTREKYKIDSR